MLRAFISILTVAFVLVGCGKSPEEKVAEANSKVDQLNSLVKSLNSRGFDIGGYTATGRVPSHLSKDEIAKARKDLKRVKSLGRDLIADGNDPDVLFVESYKVELFIEQADACLDQLNTVEQAQEKTKEVEAELARAQELHEQGTALIQKWKNKITCYECAGYPKHQASLREIGSGLNPNELEQAYTDLKMALEDLNESLFIFRKLIGNGTVDISDLERNHKLVTDITKFWIYQIAQELGQQDAA